MQGSILVTGASGFVGTHLIAALREQGEKVVAHHSADGDIAREELRVPRDVRHVFHLAARTYVPDSWRTPREFYEVNVLGTVNVLELCRARGATLTLMSSYVYGRPERLPIDEEHPVRAFNPYAHSKILAEQAAAFYQSSFGVVVTIVRPFNLYGPGQASHFLIPTLVRQAVDPACEAITVADERPKRDYLFIDDLVDLLVRQLNKRETGGIYNAGSGMSVSVLDLASIVADAAGTTKPVVSRGEQRPDEVLDTVACIARARCEFGWSPKVTLAEGLRRIIERGH
jgi:nucleoside-diphosphate-sugar epimerase